MSFDAAEEGEEECWLVGRGLCSLDSIEPPPSPTASLLFFHGNALTDCHFAAQCGRAEPAFPHATLLDVSSNALTELDASVVAADCPALQSLDASANRISCVTGAVGALAHLRVLKLPFNQVASLAWLAGGHPLLEELDVRDNAVHHVHELPHLAALRALRHLWLQDATLDSASRVHSARANPVCAHAHYVATVLASCPALETLDGMRVAAWRQLLPQMAAAAEAPPPAPAPPAAPTHVSTAPMPVDVGVRAVGGSGAAPQMVLPTVMSTTFIPSPELAPPIPAGASLIPALSTPAIDRAANR
ncbi:leucine-rich repeat domain-containing protein, partial [archaeon]